MKRLFTGFIAFGFLVGASCVSPGELGDACDTRGSESECVDGAICSRDENEEILCLQVCEEQEDCPADKNCNGVSGSSIKSCQ
jgi:hypothetical protein